MHLGTNWKRRLAGLCMAAALFAACGGEGDGPAAPDESVPWQLVSSEGAEALLGVGGRSFRDVFAVGADQGRGPVILHFDGRTWSRLRSGVRGDLWCVFAVPEGPVLLGGSHGNVLSYDGVSFQRMQTPGRSSHTVYGIWGRGPDDVYAVGSVAGRNGFIWHFDGEAWIELDVAASELPTSPEGDTPGFFKVWGDARGGVWVVGDDGLVLHARDGGPFERVQTGARERLLTVHAVGDRIAAVGGEQEGTLIELWPDRRSATRLRGGAPLQGVALVGEAEGWAVGEGGAIYRRTSRGWAAEPHGLTLGVEALQSVWIDEAGGVWAVGGNLLSPALDQGVLLRRGSRIPPVARGLVEAPDDEPAAFCPEDSIDPVPDRSIARRWNEQALAAIRRDFPHPGVHARNLFHLSAAMWDAWVAYEPTGRGLFVPDKAEVGDADPEQAREEAISYAAYHLLAHRYRASAGADVSLSCFRGLMERLGHDPDDPGSAPAALGLRIAETIIEAGMEDGSNEANGYADTTGFVAVNPPLVVAEPGADLVDPSAWQPLNLAVAVTQNGLITEAGVQGYIGANWGLVAPFALPPRAPGEPYHDPGPPPEFGPSIREDVVDVLRLASLFDDSTSIDVSPAGMGNNPFGTNEGTGYERNPVTDLPYEPQLARLGDYGRVVAEFWADGPNSETPPGHWNVLANTVADHPDFVRRWRGEGEELSPLEWDVRMYLALNGATHDAAIAAWQLKRAHTTVRPISLVRYMGGLGQSSDPDGPSYHPDGLPLVEGLIEVVTEESSRPGERHAHLARFVGQIAVRSWRGEPGDPTTEVGGVGWIRAVEWMPYQLRTFVTPAFPGYVSGHSTFSRAAAEVLAAATGSPYFPGGMGEFVARPGYLTFEYGPEAEVRLQWATYYDAADQSGRSRVWGGIHIRADDGPGRQVGQLVAVDALARAETLFEE